MDALPCDDAERFSLECDRLPWDRTLLNDMLLPLREIRIRTADGRPADSLVCALREDGSCRNVFIAHAGPAVHGVPDSPESYRITLNGLWTVSLWDTRTGGVSAMEAEYTESATVLTWDCFAQDSLLLRLTPADHAVCRPAVNRAAAGSSSAIRMAGEIRLGRDPRTERMLPPPGEILRHEDNVLVLDTAEWRTDEDPWEETEEMLRIGVMAKEKLGISTATATGAQPWVLPPEEPAHTLSLRITFRAETALDEARLALEDAETSRVLFNGRPLDTEQDGFFTDEAIACFRTGPVPAGLNTVEITKPLAASTCTENLFLLGDFGVRVSGAETAVIPAPHTLSYGDWTVQGLPFYSGPLTYRWRLEGGERLRLRLGLFSAPCVTVELDGRRIANLSLSPLKRISGCFRRESISSISPSIRAGSTLSAPST